MVAPSGVDTAAVSETHRDTKETREPVRLGLRATVNPDTLSFTHAKDKHTLSFVVENTGESMEIFKIKTTASYLYRIRPVFFKLAVRDRQEVTVTYKGKDAGPIPLSAKDRITVVFAHALDPKRTTSALWDLHKPFAHLSYAESREYVRVLFVDETGRLAVNEKSRGGLERPKIKDQRSATVRPEPPRRAVAPAPAQEEDEKSNNTAADNETDTPSNAPAPRQRSVAPRTPRSPARAAPKQAPRTPSPNSRQSPKDLKRSPAAGRSSSRDPIESLLSSVAKDASAIVCVQYPGGRGNEEGATVEEEASRREEESIKKRDMDTDGRRDEVLRKKMEEMRKREDEDKSIRRRDDERKEERRKREEEREERKKREEERRAEEEERRKKEDEAAEEEKAAAAVKPRRRTSNEENKQEQQAPVEEEKAAAVKPRRRTSNEENKQEQQAPVEESPRPKTPRARKLGPDGQYYDDDSNYLDEDIRKDRPSVRLLKKGARTGTGSRDNSVEDDQPRRTSLEEDN